jgi:hypothetical protein
VAAENQLSSAIAPEDNAPQRTPPANPAGLCLPNVVVALSNALDNLHHRTPPLLDGPQHDIASYHRQRRIHEINQAFTFVKLLARNLNKCSYKEAEARGLLKKDVWLNLRGGDQKSLASRAEVIKQR